MLDILWRGTKEVNRFKMWHWFFLFVNGIYQFYREYFFLKKFRLWIPNTNYTNLQIIN